mgnify:CR=1 FL=1
MDCVNPRSKSRSCTLGSQRLKEAVVVQTQELVDQQLCVHRELSEALHRELSEQVKQELSEQVKHLGAQIEDLGKSCS